MEVEEPDDELAEDAALPDLAEHRVTCPYCWASISLLIDLTVPEQEYVEDCEVCCRPMHVVARVAGGVADLEVTQLE